MAVLNFFAFLNVYKSKTQLIKIHNSLNSSRRYGRLFENKKKERLGNYFCLKMISKFSKKTSTFQRPRNQPKTWNSDLTWNFFAHALLHMNLIQYKNCFGHLIETSPSFECKIIKKSSKKAKKLNFTIFWVLRFWK